jgi:hypothetical protein
MEKNKKIIITDSNQQLFSFQDKKDLCEDINLYHIPQNLDEIELQIDRLKQRWNEFTYLIGHRLKYIHFNRLYELKGYADFSTYVKVALKFSENNAYYYIAVFDYFTEEQTRIAGSKLKLIIPLLNKVKKDKELTDDMKQQKISGLRNELYFKIKNKSYREAEKIIKEMKTKYFNELKDIQKEINKIDVKKNKIIIYEENENIKTALIQLIEQFYLNN